MQSSRDLINAQAIIDILEQEATNSGSTIKGLISTKFNRLFLDIKDEKSVLKQCGAEHQIKYMSWDPKPVFDEDTLKKFKEHFVDYFFDEIKQNDIWQTFLTTNDLDATDSDRIAMALVSKLYANNFRSITDDTQEKKIIFSKFSAYQWKGGEEDKDFQEFFNEKRKELFEKEFTASILKDLYLDDKDNFDKNLALFVTNIKSSVYYKNFSAEENDALLKQVLDEAKNNINALPAGDKKELGNKKIGKILNSLDKLKEQGFNPEVQYSPSIFKRASNVLKKKPTPQSSREVTPVSSPEIRKKSDTVLTETAQSPGITKKSGSFFGRSRTPTTPPSTPRPEKKS